MKTDRNWLAASVLLVALSGCGRSATAPVESTVEAGHDHGGWWCVEHGIPEEVCARCDTKYAMERKAAGDWCAEHETPESQCFSCHPEVAEKFAAQYEAKYGTKPPAVTASHESHDGHDHG